jgi:hypothetical protein
MKSPHNRKLLGYTAASILALLAPVSAQAIGFEGYYAYPGWTTTNTSTSNNGVVLTDTPVVGQIQLKGPFKSTSGNSSAGAISYTIVAEAEGSFSFDFSYFVANVNSNYSAGYYLYYGDPHAPPTNLAGGRHTVVQSSSGLWTGSSGTIDIFAQGNTLPTIGFFVSTLATTITQTNRAKIDIIGFSVISSAVGSVPEPSILSLFAAGAFGISLVRQKKRFLTKI